MYRALTLHALRRGVDPDDEEEVAKLLAQTEIAFRRIGHKQHVLLNGEDVTSAIRSPEVSANVSQFARLPKVRSKMLELQRQLAGRGNTVMDGRDIGTRVLPDAEVKVFLTASVEERAKRRYLELKRNGFEADLSRLKEEIIRRDKMDSEREIAPLRRAADAVLLDTTGMSVEEVSRRIIDLYEKATGR
ncbi:(d)CMP kinase [Bacillaceae bacterium]